MFLLLTGIRINSHVEQAVTDSGIQKDNDLFALCPKMSVLLLRSKSDNTTKSYFSAFQRWENFISGHGYSALPAQPIHVALYITHMLDNGSTYHSVNSAIYAIKWAHEVNGMSDPTKNSFVTALQEAARRTSAKKVVKKEQVSSDMLIKLCEKFRLSNDVLIVRDLTMILLSFAAFLRFDEISSLKFSNLKIKENCLVIDVEKSKTNQYRQDNYILIAKGETIACSYNMYMKYISLAVFEDGSDMYLFRPCFRSNGESKLIHKNK